MMSQNDFREISDKKIFEQMYQELAAQILEELPKKYEMPLQAVEWFRRSLDASVPGGKMNRGLSVLDTFKTLKNQELTVEEEKKAMVLGWCVEWLQAFFLIADDIMDSSITRRGKPCWYKNDGVGMIAINDSFLTESCIYILLKKYFRDTCYYTDLLELFHEVTYQTELGQMLDLITAPEGKCDLSQFSMERYKLIVKYKTAFYSFYLPVILAMLMFGIQDETIFSSSKKILLEMGEFFQIQDDYLDCFGDPKIIGKIGTDIQDNKCGWLINKALEICTPDQKFLLEKNYGRKDDVSVEKVKGVYRELQLPKLFQQFEEESYHRLTKFIDETQPSVPKKIFTDFAKKIYKRTH
eukprot:Sdes_comp18307_c0_seq1m8017